MTKFTDCSGDKKEVKETVLTHYLDTSEGWVKHHLKVNDGVIEEIKYMGSCITDGDIFIVYCATGNISQYKGIKGDEEYT